jgi:hypothetical protein
VLGAPSHAVHFPDSVSLCQCPAVLQQSLPLQVYLKSSFLLREGEADWVVFMETFLSSSAAANKWFLNMVTKDTRSVGGQESDNPEDYLETYLYWCEVVSCSPSTRLFQDCNHVWL